MTISYKNKSLCKSSPNYVLRFASFSSCHPWQSLSRPLSYPRWKDSLKKRVVKFYWKLSINANSFFQLCTTEKTRRRTGLSKSTSPSGFAAPSRAEVSLTNSDSSHYLLFKPFFTQVWSMMVKYEKIWLKAQSKIFHPEEKPELDL